MKNSFPTTYPGLNQVLEILVASVKEVLQEHFVRAYLQGSFATGDYDLHSDVDFTIVVQEGLSDLQIDNLNMVHSHIYELDSRWAKRLDGSYFPDKVLRRHDLLDEVLWYLDNGHNSMVKSTHCNTLVVRWVLREHGVALVGPAPDTLVDLVETDVLRREIFEVSNDWGEEILQNPQHYNNRFYQSFIVLSYCRMLHSLLTGRVASKRAGAEWAKTDLDPALGGMIDRSWASRPNPSVSSRQPAEAEDFAATLDFTRYAIQESNRLME